MFLAVWYGMKKSYKNDDRIERGEKPEEWNDPVLSTVTFTAS